MDVLVNPTPVKLTYQQFSLVPAHNLFSVKDAGGRELGQLAVEQQGWQTRFALQVDGQVARVTPDLSSSGDDIALAVRQAVSTLLAHFNMVLDDGYPVLS